MSSHGQVIDLPNFQLPDSRRHCLDGLRLRVSELKQCLGICLFRRLQEILALFPRCSLNQDYISFGIHSSREPSSAYDSSGHRFGARSPSSAHLIRSPPMILKAFTGTPLRISGKRRQLSKTGRIGSLTRRFFRFRALEDSNLRPTGSKPGTLSS